MSKLKEDFYQRENVLAISRDLLGKVLCTNFQGELTSGIIVETEAYAGVTDKASHAHGGKRTRRTEIMYTNGGIAYIYLCYGIHHLFNIVTNKENIPHAILIRAIEPKNGIEFMLRRREKKKLDHSLSSGPGSTSQSLGLTIKHSGTPLTNNLIWVEDQSFHIQNSAICTKARVGVKYAEEDSLNPWRFQIANNPWVSPAS